MIEWILKWKIVIDTKEKDVYEEEDEIKVVTTKENLQSTTEGLEKLGYKAKTAENTRIPSNSTEISDPETARKVLLLMEKLEEHDDVQNVYSNFDIPDEIMEKVNI